MALSLNGQAVSWADVEVTLNPSILVVQSPTPPPVLVPLKLPTITAIDYDITVERQLVYGSGMAPYDQTKGIIKPGPVKVTLGRSDFDGFFSLLGGMQGYILNVFDISINYSYNLTTPATDLIQGCRLSKFTTSPKQGPEPIMVELEITPIKYVLGNSALGSNLPPGF